MNKDELESDITTLWISDLKIERTSRNDNYFDLGGTSTSIIIFLAEVMEKYCVEIDLEEFFENPTINCLCRLIQKKL